MQRRDYYDGYEEGVMHAYRYSLWSCAGCDEATLECQVAWQSAFPQDEEEWEDNGPQDYFPPRRIDSIKPKVFVNIKPEVDQLYKELVVCLNQDCPLLSTIGLRALIEGICADKGITDGNLEQKINGLHNSRRNHTSAGVCIRPRMRLWGWRSPCASYTVSTSCSSSSSSSTSRIHGSHNPSISSARPRCHSDGC